jgi:multidrug efflux pump subunit AcrB
VLGLAQKLAQRLQDTKKLTDIWVNQEPAPRPCLLVDVDVARARVVGVNLEDISNALQIYVGAEFVNNFNRFGKTFQIVVLTNNRSGKRIEDLQQIKLRNDKGQMIPLSSFATTRPSERPIVVNRLDLRPMVEITANPAAEDSLAQARKLCETLLEELRTESRLSPEYRLTWLQEPPQS